MPSHNYEVRVSGPLDELEHLDELGVVRSVDREITTSLTGRFDDQDALSAFLRRLRALGLEVVEIRRVADVEDLEDGEGTDAGDAGDDGASR
jgi:hypothetical protein